VVDGWTTAVARLVRDEEWGFFGEKRDEEAPPVLGQSRVVR